VVCGLVRGGVGFGVYGRRDAVIASAMTAESGGQILRCEECGRVWLPSDVDNWRAYRSCDDELVVYCPACAKREFGSATGRPEPR
jgi:hypothetical protein